MELTGTGARHPTQAKRKWVGATLLLLSGVPVLIACGVLGFQIRQENLDYALFQAIQRRDAPTVVTLLGQGANANAREKERPPQTLAQIVAKLVAQVRHNGSYLTTHVGATALYTVLTSGNLSATSNLPVSGLDAADAEPLDRMATELIQHGANYTDNWNPTLPPLALATGHRMHRTMRLLLARGASVDERYGAGVTSLAAAVENGDLEGVQILLEQGASVNATDFSGGSILSHASRTTTGETSEIVRLLKQHGARLNLRDPAPGK